MLGDDRNETLCDLRGEALRCIEKYSEKEDEESKTITNLASAIYTLVEIMDNHEARLKMAEKGMFAIRDAYWNIGR